MAQSRRCGAADSPLNEPPATVGNETGTNGPVGGRLNGVPTITSELDTTKSALRAIIEPHKTIYDGWRTQTLTKVEGKRTAILENKNWGGVAGQGIDHRIRWYLTGFTEPVLPDTVTAGLARCNKNTIELVTGLAARLAGTRFGSHRSSVERDACLLGMIAGMAEAVFRAGVPCPIDDYDTLDDVATHYRAALDDIITMSGGLSSTLEPFDDAETIDTGPAVQTGRINGDADLIIDQCLVETKAIVDPKRDLTRACRQLFVYAAMTGAEINEVALALPRQRVTTRFEIARHRDALTKVRNEIAAAY